MPWFTIYHKSHPEEDFVSADDIEASDAREALAEARRMYPRAVDVKVIPEKEHIHGRRDLLGFTDEENRQLQKDIFS